MRFLCNTLLTLSLLSIDSNLIIYEVRLCALDLLTERRSMNLHQNFLVVNFSQALFKNNVTIKLEVFSTLYLPSIKISHIHQGKWIKRFASLKLLTFRSFQASQILKDLLQMEKRSHRFYVLRFVEASQFDPTLLPTNQLFDKIVLTEINSAKRLILHCDCEFNKSQLRLKAKSSEKFADCKQFFKINNLTRCRWSMIHLEINDDSRYFLSSLTIQLLPFISTFFNLTLNWSLPPVDLVGFWVRIYYCESLQCALCEVVCWTFYW